MALHPHRYLDLIQSEAERMATLAPPALDVPVPPCPGWNVAEVIRHTASVFGHKVATIRLGRQPRAGEWHATPPESRELVAWFRSALRELLDELASHDPDEQTYSWWPPDQTVGFWYRRMALETVVHRVDVESAVSAVTPVDAALAVDGVDEVLTVFLETRHPDDDVGTAGVVDVAADGTAWRVRMAERGVLVQRAATDGASARLSGPAGPLFLYLWGRSPLEGLGVDGDTGAILELRRRLVAATQ